MADLPYMKWYPRDFQSDAAHLSPTAELAYRRLLEFMWLRGGALPNDADVLSALARVRRCDWGHVWEKISGYFVESEPGKITQPRIVRDIAAQAERRTALAEYGARGGRAKANKINGHAVAEAKPTPSIPEPEAEPDPKVEINTTAREDETDAAFGAYNALARRIGLNTAQRINPQRRARLRARLKEAGGLQGWLAALNKIEASPYCRGEVNGFRADLDFLLQESSFIKVMEGKYDDRKPVKGSGKPTISSALEELGEYITSHEV